MHNLNEPKKEWTSVELPTGWIGHDIYSSDSCFAHRFGVTGKNSLQIIAVECLMPMNKPRLSFSPIYESNGFTVYRLHRKNLNEIRSLEPQTPVIIAKRSGSADYSLRVVGNEKILSENLSDSSAYLVFMDPL